MFNALLLPRLVVRILHMVWGLSYRQSRSSGHTASHDTSIHTIISSFKLLFSWKPAALHCFHTPAPWLLQSQLAIWKHGLSGAQQALAANNQNEAMHQWMSLRSLQAIMQREDMMRITLAPFLHCNRHACFLA